MKYDIISVGSASIDAFITSKSKDIEIEKIHSHEDVCLPIGAKIKIDTLCTEVGGSAVNSATSFSRLGFKTAILAKLGDDLHSQIVLEKLKKEKINFIGKCASGQTGLTIAISGLKGNRTLLAYKGNNDKLTKKDVPWKNLKTKWFYFGTMFDKSWKAQCKIAKYASKHKIPILYNPSLYVAEKGAKYLRPVLKETKILILNKEEARALTGINAGTKTQLKLLQKNTPLVVITDGKKGAHAYNGIKTYSISPKKTKILDTTGAGDAFASGFLSAIIRKQDIPTALKWGTAQAASVLGQYGSTNNLLNKNQIKKYAGRVKEV